jgi:hypothetical protein
VDDAVAQVCAILVAEDRLDFEGQILAENASICGKLTSVLSLSCIWTPSLSELIVTAPAF